MNKGVPKFSVGSPSLRSHVDAEQLSDLPRSRGGMSPRVMEPRPADETCVRSLDCALERAALSLLDSARDSWRDTGLSRVCGLPKYLYKAVFEVAK